MHKKMSRFILSLNPEQVQQTRNASNLHRNQTIKAKGNNTIAKLEVRYLMPSEKNLHTSARQSEKFFSTFSSFQKDEIPKPKRERRLPTLKFKDKSENPSIVHSPSQIIAHPPLISSPQKAPITSRDISYMLDQEHKGIGLKESHSLERKKLLATIGVEEESELLDHFPISISELMDKRLRIKEEFLNSVFDKYIIFIKSLKTL